MRLALRAVARENARVEALLADFEGETPGSGEVVRPVAGQTTLRFGELWDRLHAGIDIDVPAGTPVHAADSGRVVLSGVVGAYGKYICIQHTDALATCYAHNSKLRVREGETVGFGDVIATSGCTGECYADHLQFEVREDGEPVDPRDYL